MRRLLLLLAMMLCLPGVARAACDCATSTVPPYCTGSSISHTSHISGSPANTLTVTFDKSYTCGQYATGDYWIVGDANHTVTVTNTSPTYDGTRHGYGVNMDWEAQSLDRRTHTSVAAPALTTYTISPTNPTSFIKAIGRDTNPGTPSAYLCHNSAPNNGLRETCVRYAKAVTFVYAIPDSDTDLTTADEFRPGTMGATKIGPFTVDMMESRAQALGFLPTTPIANVGDLPFSTIRDRYSCAYVYHRTGTIQMPASADCLMMGHLTTDQAAYGGGIAVANRLVALRFLLSDFSWSNSINRQALINYVQHGIDLAQAVSAGWRTREAAWPVGGGRLAPGGITSGHKTPVVFAAYMLQQADIVGIARGDGSDGRGYFFESDQVYVSPVNGVIYYGTGSTGAGGMDAHCQNGTATGDYNSHCYWYTLTEDAGCHGGKNYSEAVANSFNTVSLWVRALGAQYYWNDDAWLDYAYKWDKGGRQAGHNHWKWTSGAHPFVEIGQCNDNGNRSCLGQCYRTVLGEQIWAAYFDYVPTDPIPHCGDQVINRPEEQCDGVDDDACPGQCQANCTCPSPPPPHETLVIGGRFTAGGGVVLGVSHSNTDGDDADLDGHIDSADNCTLLPNLDQIDSDGDCFGNRCDPDHVNPAGDPPGDNIVGSPDFNAFRSHYGTVSTDPTYDRGYDYDNNNAVGSSDFNTFRSFYQGGPGPSGLCPGGGQAVGGTVSVP